MNSIDECVEAFARSLNTQWNGKVFADPHQGAAVTFLYPGAAGNPAIELVEPTGADAPALRFLKSGGGLHHVCYEVSDLTATLASWDKSEARIVRQPSPAVAFDSRPIAWVYTRYGLLVELLEAERQRCYADAALALVQSEGAK